MDSKIFLEDQEETKSDNGKEDNIALEIHDRKSRIAERKKANTQTKNKKSSSRDFDLLSRSTDRKNDSKSTDRNREELIEHDFSTS